MSKTVTIHLLGGLGNQLYQYAVARYIQQKYNYDLLILDITGYKKFKLRDNELINFALNDKVIFGTKKKFIYSIVVKAFHVYQKLYSTITRKHAPMYDFKIFGNEYLCTGVEFRNDCLINEGSLYMYGYFVNSAVVNDMKKVLIKDLVFSSTSCSKEFFDMKNKIMEHICIGVSIRCEDDYVNNGWPVCTKEFYLSGIKQLQNEFGEIPIFIFADNIDKVKKEGWFENREVTYIEHFTVSESFELLRSCNHYVTSNSSFSWWGSYLTYSSDSKTISSYEVFPSDFSYLDSYTHRYDVVYLNYNDGKKYEGVLK